MSSMHIIKIAVLKFKESRQCPDAGSPKNDSSLSNFYIFSKVVTVLRV